MSRRAGRHFLQIPGPSPVPERLVRACSKSVIDHRGPDFADLGFYVLNGMQRIFQTTSPVIIYPSSGTGAWEACLVNLLIPGDKVLFFDNIGNIFPVERSTMDCMFHIFWQKGHIWLAGTTCF